MKKFKRLFLGGMVLSMSSGLVNFNYQTNSPLTVSAQEQEEVVFPVKIKHALGETVIEEKPERIAAIGWGNGEVALALDVAPVLLPMANWGVKEGEDLHPWVIEKYKELNAEVKTYSDADGYNFEALSAAEPDLILAGNSGLTQEEYDQMSEIAPVVAYPDQPWQIDWRDNIKMGSKAMGLEQEGLDLVDKIESMLKEEVAKRPEIEGKTAAFLYINVQDMSEFSIYTPGDSRGAYLSEFGLDLSDGIKEITDKTDDFYLTISAEEAECLNDLDIIVTYGTAEDLETMQSHPIMGKVPAIKRGSVVLLANDEPMGAAASPGALSIQAMTPEYLDRIQEAAKKCN